MKTAQKIVSLAFCVFLIYGVGGIFIEETVPLWNRMIIFLFNIIYIIATLVYYMEKHPRMYLYVNLVIIVLIVLLSDMLLAFLHKTIDFSFSDYIHMVLFGFNFAIMITYSIYEVYMERSNLKGDESLLNEGSILK